MSPRALRITFYTVLALLLVPNVLGGIGDLMRHPEIEANVTRLGYPAALLPLLGVARIGGAAAIAWSPWRDVRVAGYTGYVFFGLGAAYAHLSAGDAVVRALPGLVFAALAVAGYLLWRRREREAATTLPA